MVLFFPPLPVKYFLCTGDVYSFKGKGILFTCKSSLSNCMNIVKSMSVLFNFKSVILR